MRTSRQRIVEVRHEDRPVIIKRATQIKRGRAQAALLGWYCKRLTGTRLSNAALRPVGGSQQLEHEARRILKLQQAGERVPDVIALGGDWLALSHVGPNFEHVLAGQEAAASLQTLHRLARDLGRFHAAGHWHGGAQLRNLTESDGEIYRIDFEEDFRAMSLSLRQALDVLLFLSSSVMPLLAGANEDLACQQGADLLEAYFLLADQAEVRSCLQRAWRTMNWTHRPLKLMGSHLGKDGIRLRSTAGMLARYFN